MGTILAGFGISISLIASIGAQNVFLLKQGIKKQHVLPIVLAYILSDIILVSAGVFGFGSAVQNFPTLMLVIKWGGIIFLVGYGIKSLYSAIALKHGMTAETAKKASLKKTLMIFLAFTWLNPQVYLDTIVLIGGISAQFSPNEVLFWIGAMLASIVYACLLGYGSQKLTPLFKKAITWKVLELIIALIMFTIAGKLYFS